MHCLFRILRVAAVISPLLFVNQARAQRDVAADSLVVTTDWLAAHLTDPTVVVIEVVHEPGKRGKHIPGSRALFYRNITVTRDGLSTELPPVDSLRALLEGLGISNASRVVVYASEAPMATRLLLTLEYLGHQRKSYLDGGVQKWAAEGKPLTEDEPAIVRGALTLSPRTDMIVTADWISPRVGKSGTALIDTRTDGEYNGTGNRSGMPSAGHLAGARQLEWESLFTADNGLLLKDRVTLQKLFADRTASGDTLVTYCWVGYRASATWFVARLLGFDAKFYDGSYQDWQVRKLPVKAGTAP